MKNLVVLIGKEDVTSLKEFLISENKIISFDFNAHKELDSLGISHELIENYFELEEQEEIDNLAIKFTTNWYQIDKINELIKYNDLRLGNLLEIELITFIIEILKKMIGFRKLLEKEKYSKIYASSLNEIVEYFGLENSYRVKNLKKFNDTLYFDKIEIPISFGGKTKTIKISRNNFTKIKKIIEKTTNLVFNLKYKFGNDEIILLLDFNPTIYPSLLRELGSKHENIILFNQRRPAVWNFDSLKIVKNSGCKTINIEDLRDDRSDKKVGIEHQNIIKKLNKMWEYNEDFEKFFSIDGQSFWKLIKNQFQKMVEERFVEAISRYILIENFFQKNHVHSVLEWAHNGFEEKIVIDIAKNNNIPIYLLQHGTAPINEKWNKYHYLMPYFPTLGIKLITWGKAMKEFVLQNKIQEEQVLDLGSPRHDMFFLSDKTAVHSMILIAANGFMHNNFAGNDSRSYQYLEDYFSEICKTVPKISNKQIIVKLHPGQFYYDMKPLINKIDPKIPIFQNQNILNLIKKCDVMISLNYSTALLDAMILQKPTMLVLPEKQGYEKEDFVTKGATLFEPNIENIGKALNEILNNEDYRTSLIKKGNEFVDYYLVNKGIASKEIVNVILDQKHH